MLQFWRDGPLGVARGDLGGDKTGDFQQDNVAKEQLLCQEGSKWQCGMLIWTTCTKV